MAAETNPASALSKIMAASQPFAGENVGDRKREKDRAQPKHDEIQHRDIPSLKEPDLDFSASSFDRELRARI